MSNEKVQNLINNGYEFRMGDYIYEGWDLFKKNAGGFVMFTLFIFILSGGFAYANYVTNSFISIVNSLIQPMLVMGYFIVADKLHNNEPVEFGDFFKAFNGNWFVKLFAVSLLSGILMIIGFILLILPGIYLVVAYSFCTLFVYFKGYGAWEAMEASRKVIGKNWFSFFVFFIVIILINLLGLICLGVGLLVSMPVSVCAMYVAFNDIVGARESATDTNITDHLITA